MKAPCSELYSSLLFPLLLASTAYAGASDKLRNFISSSQSGQANFTQVVQDKKGKKIQSRLRHHAVRAPGKISLVYQKPYEQSSLAMARNSGCMTWT